MRLAKSNAFAKIFHLFGILSPRSYFSSTLKNLTNLLEDNPKATVRYRFTLNKGEVVQFPSACQQLQVLSGTVWITVNGDDIILSSGKKIAIPLHKDIVVISALGSVPLIVEAV